MAKKSSTLKSVGAGLGLRRLKEGEEIKLPAAQEFEVCEGGGTFRDEDGIVVAILTGDHLVQFQSSAPPQQRSPQRRRADYEDIGAR